MIYGIAAISPAGTPTPQWDTPANFGLLSQALTDTLYLKKNSLQVAATDYEQLGTAPSTDHALNIDTFGFGVNGLRVLASNGSANFKIQAQPTLADMGLVNFSATGRITLGANALNKWAIQPDAAGTATFGSFEPVARFQGGATSVQVLNNAGTRANLLLGDAGNQLLLNDGTQSLSLATTPASGDAAAGGLISGAATFSLSLASDTAFTTNQKVQIIYGIAAAKTSALSVSNTAAGFGNLNLMLGGGAVTIGASAALGAGVANLKLAGLTNAAAAQAGTLTNAPVAGNPTFWAPISINGVIKNFPCW